MLIPITFKADGGDSSKKGKIRPEDMSAFSSFFLKTKTGILDLLGRCEIASTSVSSLNARIVFHSGYISICGRWVYIEEGTEFNFPAPASGTEQRVICVRVDLSSTGVTECTFYQALASATLRSDDLNANPVDGVYDFALYRCNVSDSAISNITKVANVIRAGAVDAAIYPANRNGEVDGTSTTSERLAALESRLTNMGFKEGNISVDTSAWNVASNTFVKRFGKLACGRFHITYKSAYFDVLGGTVIGVISEGCRPKTTQTFYIGFTDPDYSAQVEINTNGNIIYRGAWQAFSPDERAQFDFIFGYEAEDMA